MDTLFEKAFVKALRKHSGIKKHVENSAPGEAWGGETMR
jgi:hypothetical protein